MESPDERTSFEDSDDSRNLSPPRSWHSESADMEKFLLLDDGNKSVSKRTWSSLWPSRVLTCVTILNLLLFFTSLVILWLSKRERSPTDQDHWRATSYYSPVLDRFEIPKVTQSTNGTFWDTDPPSIWRARTGAEADASWEAIGSNVTPIVITAEEVRKLGKDPAIVVKAPPELHLGPDAYLAGMDVFHHVHCLDKLRREISYANYHEAKEGPRPGSKLHVAHVNHCLDLLSQALRCTGSVDIVTFNWVEGHRYPQPDFNNQKVCRNFEALREWTVENGVAANFLDYAHDPPADAIIIPDEPHSQHRRL